MTQTTDDWHPDYLTQTQIDSILDGVQRDNFTSSAAELANHNAGCVNQAVFELRMIIRSRFDAKLDREIAQAIRYLEILHTRVKNPATFMSPTKRDSGS
jgi:hypothetical protein